jgi:aspartate kinase
MGNTTDLLTQKAYSVSQKPNRRELDMLLSTGERVSSAMMSLAINDLGANAVSFTGSQAGVLTDDAHTNAKVIDLRPQRVETELAGGKVVVLAGFQGVSPVTKEITTLGRGGTDLSAVCMAHYFKSKRCEILKDVDGVFSCDPKIAPDSKPIRKISFDVLRELTFWGAKMVHHRAAELAALVKQTIWIGLAHQDSIGTLVSEESMAFESEKVLSVNSHAHVLKLKIASASQGEGWKKLDHFISSKNLSWPQILDSTQTAQSTSVLITGPKETLDAIASCEESDVLTAGNSLCSVTATCSGAIGSALIGRLVQQLELAKIETHHVLLSPMSVTFVLSSDMREKAMKSLHAFA